MEKIICAAIHYDDGKEYPSQPKNISSGYVWCGRRHHNIIHLKNTLVEKTFCTIVQGFLTSRDNFLNRKDALKLAIANGQIKEGDNMHPYDLFSEDLY